MKTLGALVLLLCVVYVTSQACPPACTEPNDCCLKPNGANDPGRCSPRLPRNARCRTYDVQRNGGYLYDCPCRDNLYCRSGRCTEPTTFPTRPTPSPPTPEPTPGPTLEE